MSGERGRNVNLNLLQILDPLSSALLLCMYYSISDLLSFVIYQSGTAVDFSLFLASIFVEKRLSSLYLLRFQALILLELLRYVDR